MLQWPLLQASLLPASLCEQSAVMNLSARPTLRGKLLTGRSLTRARPRRLCLLALVPVPAWGPVRGVPGTLAGSCRLAASVLSPQPALHCVRHRAGPRHPARMGRAAGRRPSAPGVERFSPPGGRAQHLQLADSAVPQRLLHQQVRLLHPVLQ